VTAPLAGISAAAAAAGVGDVDAVMLGTAAKGRRRRY